MPETDRVTLRRPDDWHLHLRDGPTLRAVLPFTAERFARAIVMPNLVPPVTTARAAEAYRARILAALPDGARFTPLMTCYLTDDTPPDELEAGRREGAWIAAKLYPAHATTNAAHGVTDLRRLRPCLERMERIGMPLLVHGEVTDPEVDVFDREAVFLDRVLAPLLRDHPGLKAVLEHVTTAAGVAFVEEAAGDRLAGTITVQHLMLNRNAMLVGGIRPHLYCLPILKTEPDRRARRRAATSASPRFFLGTDSAPHPVHAKECACGCAGCFTAPAALELYAQVFEEEGALGRLEAFASLNGPRFYGLPANEGRVALRRGPWTVPDEVAVEGEARAVRPFMAGEGVGWRMDAAAPLV
jgi:dihydroorotase